MRIVSKKSVVLASAVLASFSLLRNSSAASTAVLIEGNQSAVVDGWNISVPTGVALTVTTSDNEIFVEKAANFTQPNQGFQVAFQPVKGVTGATSIDFTDESIQNNSGKAFNGFQFILINTGTSNATFPSVSNVFSPPSGTGYAFTSVNLNGSKDTLSYLGHQDSGSTSLWGSAAPGDNLLINAPIGADFSFKELPSSGGTTVPLPASAWQSLFTLGGLGLVGMIRWKKRQLV
jgi:hypothetical protein